MSSHALLSGCLVLLVFAARPMPPAEPCDAPPGKVKVGVIVILASEEDARVDPKLKCIAEELKKKYPTLKGFQLAGKCTCKSLTIGEKENFDLIGDETAAVTVEKGADDEDFVQLKVTPPQMGSITYRTICGKFLPIATPVKTRKGETVLIAIRVQPCNGK